MTLTLLTLLTILLAALQARLPTAWWLGGLRIELLPALVAYAALTFTGRRALWLAIAAGLTQDSLSGAPFGISAVAYGVATAIMTGMRETLDRDLPWVQMGAGVLTAAAVSVAACFVVGFSISKLLALTALSAGLTPLVFFAGDFTRYKLRT